MQEPVKVYWAPTCSNCMRLKAYISARGVDYESINVADDLEALRALAPLGVKTFPVVVKGDRFVFGMDLDGVNDLLGLNEKPQKIPAEDIPRRLVKMIQAWLRFSRQVPPSTYDIVVPGLEGSPPSACRAATGSN